jgi:hypothetical protein
MLTASAKHLLSVSVSAFILAACSAGSGSPVTPIRSSTATEIAQLRTAGNHILDVRMLVTPTNVRLRPHRVASVKVIKPNCCALQKTLFVVDGYAGGSFAGAVYMFDYLTGVLLGQLASPPEGWAEPLAACSDTSGNVYITNIRISTMDEYSHSGTYVATFEDPGQFPSGCAYDKSTGDIAVSNLIAYDGGPGSISIYHGGVLQNTYYPSNMSRVVFLGYYGTSGTLFLDGSDSSGYFQYDSFKNGSFKNVGVHGADIGFPGTVAWSGKTGLMNIGDQDTFSTPTFYEVDASGNVRGSVVTECAQESDFCDIIQASIKGPGLVAPDGVAGTVNRFPYPAGGDPNLSYPAGFELPSGTAVSPEKGSGE